MELEPNIFALAIFGAVTLVAWWTMGTVARTHMAQLRERLRSGDIDYGVAQTVLERLGEMAERLSQLLSIPFMPTRPEGQAALRRRLGYAGLYGGSAMTLFAGAKVICVIGGIALGTTLGVLLEEMMFGISIGGLVGYVLPTIWLGRRVDRHRIEMERALPDALDLLVVCVESGLTVDASMQRVAEELKIAHPRLCQELEITHMETRVGVPRPEALKNLGRRTGSGPLQALASMLVQAERFGTSVASALRVHAEALRMSRQHLAEENAAKASVKLSFPVVLFIFPAVLIVLGGPALIGLFKSALFAD